VESFAAHVKYASSSQAVLGSYHCNATQCGPPNSESDHRSISSSSQAGLLSLECYKSKVVKIWREKDSTFCKYKDLKEEDWVRFIEKCESEPFATNSQYMQ
jgi:hypothetical protein